MRGKITYLQIESSLIEFISYILTIYIIVYSEKDVARDRVLPRESSDLLTRRLTRSNNDCALPFC